MLVLVRCYHLGSSDVNKIVLTPVEPLTARLKQCGGANMWTIAGVDTKGIKCRLGSELCVTTIDAFADSLSASLLHQGGR